MTIATRDQLIDALAHGMQGFFDKASIAGAVAGRFYSLWRASGVPTNAAIPTAPVACNKNLLGALAFSNAPSALSTHLASVDLTTSNPASTVEIHDRLCHQGGLSGAVTTAQTTNLPLPLTGVSADRIGPDDYSQLQWWLEWYTSTGTTAVNATVTVTYNDNSTGDIVVPLSASSSASGALSDLALRSREDRHQGGQQRHPQRHHGHGRQLRCDLQQVPLRCEHSGGEQGGVV